MEPGVWKSGGGDEAGRRNLEEKKRTFWLKPRTGPWDRRRRSGGDGNERKRGNNGSEK